MAKLILRSDDGADKEISLEASGSVTIGRSPECDLAISDNQASRRHCSIVRLQSGYEVADLGSTNGTLVNSTLVKRHKLKHGDVIRIGSHEIVYSDPAAAAPAGGEISNCFLVYAKGDRKGEKVELIQQRTTIGRKSTNTIALEDPVCSGYHCEIVRDLNGYTIRDLGSTNGTLVNSEMITEAQLTHGARLRIGNTRFVFQDPALAEIDLELAGIEDEEDWGMMRDLDLAAVRRRNPATIIYTVLLLAIVGGGWYMTTLERTKVQGPQPPEGNLHAPYSFESLASRHAWRSEPAGAVTLRISEATKGQGKSSLELRSNVEAATAFYGTSHSVTRGRYRLKAWVATRGGASARVGLLWSGLGLERWAATEPLTTTGEVEVRASAPPWASRLRLGVRLGGGGTVYLDDVSLVLVGSADVVTEEQNEFRFSVVDGREVDVAHAGAPILVDGRLFARGADGTATEAPDLAVKAKAVDDEHTLVTIEGAGDAAVVGVEFEEVAGFLSRGGFRAFTPDQEKSFHASFPDEGTLALQGVRKLLLGPSGRAFAVLGATDQARVQSEARVAGKRRTWAVLGPAEGGALSFRLKTDLTREGAAATDAMTQALNLLHLERYGDFLAKAQRALAEFPFASKMMRKQLAEGIQTVNRDYLAARRALDRELDDYREFRDLQSLDNARTIVEELKRKYQIEPDQTERGEHLAQAMERLTKDWGEALRKKQGDAASARLEQAVYVHIEQGEVRSAALLLAYVAWFLPDSPHAQEARDELKKIEQSHPEVIRVLKSLKLGKED
ncbi:MAG: FHA domain-containing protein [Planctomycetota bacterium]|jgi:pSer/pThr/pTyr-binding forkhead associated (FHA) protein